MGTLEHGVWKLEPRLQLGDVELVELGRGIGYRPSDLELVSA
jgi:hypothetical protein